ncbi:MAG: DegT/DnrJ/EryC1/StrS family aminotransferase [Deltaproteobacteria bacterium]|nr:DegT/DnrJ/EryC1/StrS family aminotransferase [Deltaproteobacteria bacterium]
MADFIPLCIPYLDDNDTKKVRQCVESTFVSTVGPLVAEFEERFAEFTGSKHAVACSSGTAALHLSLIASGINSQSLVVAPGFSFAASVNPIIYCNATPVLIDAESQTMNPDFQLIEKAINENSISCVIALHLYGIPAPYINNLKKLCKSKRIPLIEDATESLGATVISEGKHKYAGSFGDFGCFSFNGNKLITSGGGGMVVTDNVESANFIKHLSTQARMKGFFYEHDHVGYNYRLTNLQAALGLSQLEKIDFLLERKKEIAEKYASGFAGVEEILIPTASENSLSSHWMNTIIFRRKKTDSIKILKALANKEIETRPFWKPLFNQKPYVDSLKLENGTSQNLFEQGLCIPSSAGLKSTDQQRVIDEIKSLFTTH